LVHSGTIYLTSISGVSQPLQRLGPSYLDSDRRERVNVKSQHFFREKFLYFK